MHLSPSGKSYSLADLGGAWGTHAPPWASKFFRFHAVFGKIWRVHAPPGGFTPPPRENPGSATAIQYHNTDNPSQIIFKWGVGLSQQWGGFVTRTYHCETPQGSVTTGNPLCYAPPPRAYHSGGIWKLYIGMKMKNNWIQKGARANESYFHLFRF